MTDEQVIQLIEQEFKEKTLEPVVLLLDVHSPIYIDNKLKVDRIYRDRKNETIIAYLPVLNEKFYFSVYINTKANEVTAFGTEAYYWFAFVASSNTLSGDELKAMTSLAPTELWSNPDLGKNPNASSALMIRPNPEPDKFENKLKKLLDFLEQDKEGIKRLVDNANGYIMVGMEFHKGDGWLGRHDIDKDDIRRMSDLGLSINFELLASGNSYVDEDFFH